MQDEACGGAALLSLRAVLGSRWGASPRFAEALQYSAVTAVLQAWCGYHATVYRGIRGVRGRQQQSWLFAVAVVT